MSSTLSFILNSELNEEDFWSLAGRDELHIEKAPVGGERIGQNQRDGNI